MFPQNTIWPFACKAKRNSIRPRQKSHTLDNPAGTLVWPSRLHPNASTVPLVRKARVCMAPAAMAATLVKSAGTFVKFQSRLLAFKSAGFHHAVAQEGDIVVPAAGDGLDAGEVGLKRKGVAGRCVEIGEAPTENSSIGEEREVMPRARRNRHDVGCRDAARPVRPGGSGDCRRIWAVFSSQHGFPHVSGERPRRAAKRKAKPRRPPDQIAFTPKS